MNPDIKLKRIYEPDHAQDGVRLLVERLWPRGVSKERARLDAWLRDLAPSAELRRWYQHDVTKWQEFRQRYTRELAMSGAALDDLIRRVEEGPVTFLFAARDTQHNSAVVLREFVLERLSASTD